MRCREFLDSDFDEVLSWFTERNIPSGAMESLPQCGFIVPGVAAAFLYRTDGNFVILENFISNPWTTREQRLEAVDVIIAALLEEAKAQGYARVIAFTNHPTIKDGCHEFQDLGKYQMFIKGVL